MSVSLSLWRTIYKIRKFQSVWSTHQWCSVCQSGWSCKTIHKVEYDADQLVLVCPESIRPGSLQGTRLTTRDNPVVNIVKLQSRSLRYRSVWRHKDGEHEVPLGVALQLLLQSPVSLLMWRLIISRCQSLTSWSPATARDVLTLLEASISIHTHHHHPPPSPSPTIITITHQ